MTRTQWRVMANLGKFGSMTARDICVISDIEKTKVSRAVAALESSGMLTRTPSKDDKRAEFLSLTEAGNAAFRDLGRRALDYDRQLKAELGDTAWAELVRSLVKLVQR